MGTRIELLRLRLTSGATGHPGPVSIRVNGIDHPLNRISGGTGPGESYEGEFFIGSAIAECFLLGPTEGRWDLKEMTVAFDHGEAQVSQHHFGPLELDAGACLDIMNAQA